MPQKCCVPMCKSIWSKNCEISFHSFPKEPEIRQRWLEVFRIKTLKWETRPRVCSKHFTQQDYVFGGNVKKISKFVTPKDVFSPTVINSEQTAGTSSTLCKSSNNEGELVMMREKTEDCLKNEVARNTVSISIAKSPPKVSKRRRTEIVYSHVTPIKAPVTMPWIPESSNIPTTSFQKKDKRIPLKNKLLEENIIKKKKQCSQCVLHLNTINVLKGEVAYLKKENERLKQSSSSKKIFQISRFAKNDKKILFYTGFQTYQILLLVFRWILPSGNIMDINWYKSKSASRKYLTKLTAQDQFFLTLLRLRRGMCIETLSDLFAISKASVKNIFLTWINLMYLRLGYLDIWPNRNVLIERVPASMKQNFENVIGSIHCTEFYIQSPSSSAKQSQCHSNYKSNTTLKSLLMIEPGGAIIYISPLFTGSISDKAILQESGFLNILREKIDEGSILPGDTILADKEINVKNLLSDISLNLNIPVFRIGETQFTGPEVMTTRKIAQERILIERAIGRLKTYRILSMKIPIANLDTMDQIYTVCALLCNFRYGLIK